MPPRLPALALQRTCLGLVSQHRAVSSVSGHELARVQFEKPVKQHVDVHTAEEVAVSGGPSSADVA
jgi:hypothetical protein